MRYMYFVYYLATEARHSSSWTYGNTELSMPAKVTNFRQVADMEQVIGKHIGQQHVRVSNFIFLREEATSE